MRNLLAIDFYKLFRTKSFYVISAILLALTVFSSAIVCSGFLRTYEENLLNFGNTVGLGSMLGIAWNIVFSNFSNIGIFIAIMSILFTCSEFSFGTIKNIASKGYKRVEIYLSKFLSSAVCLGIYFVITFVASLITCVVVVGNKIPDFFKLPSHAFLPLLFVFVFLLVDISLAIMISSLVRSSGQSIAAYIVPTMISSILLNIIDVNLFGNTLKIDFRLSDYVYTSCLSEVLKFGFGTAMSHSDVVRYSFVAIGFLLVTMIIGIHFFKKRDI